MTPRQLIALNTDLGTVSGQTAEHKRLQKEAEQEAMDVLDMSYAAQT